MEQELVFTGEFDKKFRAEYRKGEGHSDPINPNHHFDIKAESSKSSTPKPETSPKPSEESHPLPSVETGPENLPLVFGYVVVDYINALLPKGVPEGSRHKWTLKLATDLMILLDGDATLVRKVLMSISWVQDIVKLRGEAELDRIMQSAQKQLQKREEENLYDPQPSKEMRRAIQQVAKRKYSDLVREEKQMATGVIDGYQDNSIEMLERMGKSLEKLFPLFPLLSLLCYGVKRKHYVVTLFLGGAFAMNLMTRCWYRFWPSPGRKCRLNHLLEIIGRMGSGKHIAVDLYKIMMGPIRKSDAEQVDALNNWNFEREQNSGAGKNKQARPRGSFRCLPPETSAAAIREAENNAKEIVDGEEVYTHVSIFDSELDNTLRQMKKSHMEAFFTLWLKAFSNEPHGSYLKTSSSIVGEYDVHANFVYTGTSDALRKQATEANFVNGLLSRITCVPMGDSNFEMMENREYTEADAEREQKLRNWASLFNATKGEIPCKDISDALHSWTARRMADAKEDGSLAMEDLVKRPCWVAINFALPFIVARHWDQMVEENGRWKCGPDFKTDKHDIALAVFIANAQLAFQRYFFLAIGEKHYDNAAAEQASNHQHQQKTLLAYRRLPNPFTSDDVKREYGYDSAGSVCSRLKRLQDDGLAQKIRTGENRGKYCKLTK